MQKSKTQQFHPEEPPIKETFISSISLDQKSSKYLPTAPVELTVAFGPYCPRCNLIVCGCSRNEVVFRRDSPANTCQHLQQEASDLRGGRYIKSKQSLPTAECAQQTSALTREYQTSILSGGDSVAKTKKKKKEKKEAKSSKSNHKMGQGDVGSCCAKYLLCMFNFVFFVSRFLMNLGFF